MSLVETTGLCIPLKEAEKIRKYLIKNNLLRNDLKIYKDNRFVYLPVKNIPEIDNINFQVCKKKFKQYKLKPKLYKDYINVPKELRHELPTSYDIIGGIILIKLPEKLRKYKQKIGESLLKSNKNIKTICLIEPVTGEYRTRNIEIIAGEKHTNTIHKEYGLKFNVDVSKTYFSSRLSGERKRIADLVKPCETIVDMFTGVAPFSIMIAKYAHPKIVYSIDKNKDAVRFAQENIKINNVLDKVEVIHSDAKEIYKKFDLEGIKADRVIMNLPFMAYEFFPYVLKIIAANSVIHYYDILKEENIKKRISYLEKKANENKIEFTKLKVIKIKTYAPREFYICVDITAKKKIMPM